MTDVCEHGWARERCPDCNPPFRALAGVVWALVAVSIVCLSFVLAWWLA